MRSDADEPRRIFLNAANVTGRGASVLVANLLPELYRALPSAEFVTVIPDTPALVAAAAAPNARLISRPRRRGSLNAVQRLIDLHFALPRLVAASRADVCLTLGDLGPAGLRCAHVIFLHNPLFVYSPRELHGHGWSPTKRRYQITQFRRSLGSARRVIVQTPVMRSRLARGYGLSESAIEVIPQPVPGHVARSTGGAGRSPLAGCAKPTRLLFLAAYYPHKNHAVLPAVVRELRARGLAAQVQIFVTLGDEAPAALRAELADCGDVITDLGRLDAAGVGDALRDASALFLPTLVESYGLIYLEAMACGTPVLTSDRDFAHWMCDGAARYFDPLRPASIADAIASLDAFARRPEVAARLSQRLREFPADWAQVAARFAGALAGGPAAPRRPVENPVR